MATAIAPWPEPPHSGAEAEHHEKKHLEEVQQLETPRISVERVSSPSSAVFPMTGMRFQLLNLSLCLCLFLSTLESTVVGTALVAITNDLGDFQICSWEITAYLLTYTGFLTILAKISDIFGRRAVLGLCLIIFLVFSIACGLPKTMIQLIVFRAFQDIGGGGMYTMAFMILPEMVPPAKYALYAGIISGMVALSSLLGPILGGVISEKGGWKWIFLLKHEPVLPWVILIDKYAMGLLLVCFFTGLALITNIIILPQKFQVVYGDSPSTSGYRLLTLTLVTPLGSAFAGLFLQKLKTPPLFIFLAGWCFIILGTGLTSSIIDLNNHFPTRQYGYQVIMGLGFGINLATVVMAAPLSFTDRNLAVGMGVSNQFRVLGGTVGVSVCANMLNNCITGRLEGVLTPLQMKSLLASPQILASISPAAQNEVRHAFAVSFQQQMQFLLGMGGAGLLVTLLMVEQFPRFQK